MDEVKLSKKVGGFVFDVTLPRASAEGEAVEIRHLVAMEREIMAVLCAYGKPTPDGFQFLRSRMRFKANQLAELFGVAPETVSRWENDKSDIPLSTWELLVLLAEEHLKGKHETLTHLREKQAQRLDPTPVAHLPNMSVALA